MNFSLEVTHKTNIAELPAVIHDVSITFLPTATYIDVFNQAKALRQRGFNPIPHIAARSIRDRIELQNFVQRLREEAQVQQVFMIAGDRAPIGNYTSTLELLETGLLDGLKIGVAGHPEGTPQLSRDDCNAILFNKNQYARDTTTEMYVVTQWSLNPDAILEWLEQIQAFNTLPIRIGIPGPTSLPALMKFAAICGVRTSLGAFSRQSRKLTQLATLQTPDYLIDALQPHIDQFHIFPFGGIKRTADWLTSRLIWDSDPTLINC